MNDRIAGTRAPRFQDNPEWPVLWCPKHCCGSVDTFPERNNKRCYRGWEFDEDCGLLKVEVVLLDALGGTHEEWCSTYKNVGGCSCSQEVAALGGTDK